MEIKLSKPFAANSAVDEFDVRQIKKTLNRLGYYQPYEKTGITGIPDTGVFAALKTFQKDQGLTPTGAAKPGDDTVKALNKEFDNKESGKYIWRTAGDNKVRSSHAALDGAVRDFSDSPDPGEEFNCRCWADPVQSDQEKEYDCDDQEKAWVNAGAKLFIARQNLDRAEKEKSSFESQKLEKESELAKIDAQIEKEKKDKRDAQNKGAAVGAAAGAIIGAPAGAGSSMGLAGIGIGLGAKGGRFAEEIGDAISSKSETDLSLGIKKQHLLKEIKEIQKKIETIMNKINTVLMPEVQKAQKEEAMAKAALRACREKGKK